MHLGKIVLRFYYILKIIIILDNEHFGQRVVPFCQTERYDLGKLAQVRDDVIPVPVLSDGNILQNCTHRSENIEQFSVW